MTLLQIKDHFFKELENLYPETEIQSFFDLIVEHNFGVRRIDMALKPELYSESWRDRPFQEALEDLKKERPIQYIIGETEFAGMPFYVDENVLIPRPETEELVIWIVETARELQSPKILDIGTGSGCIPIALAKNLPSAEIQALDASSKALEIAQKNAARLNKKVKFFLHDILSPNQLYQSYDVFVSNPPYVRQSEKGQMRGNVLRHEPDLALFVSDLDPLQFYRSIAEHGQHSLHSGGLVFFEINENLANDTTLLLSDMGYQDIVTKKDIYGKDRMIRAVKK